MPKPITIILIIATIALAIFLVLLISNAVKSKKLRTTKNHLRKNVSEKELEIYVGKLQKMIRCKTVFKEENLEEFQKFRDVVKEEFPLLNSQCQLLTFGSGCIVYKLSGKNATKNIMLMSHHDVVDAPGEWSHPPFVGEISDGAMFGRGTIDTKTPFFAQLQSIENLLEQGFEFEGINVFLGSSNNEEVCGDGMPEAVKFFKDNNIRFSVVLDEGGAITTGMMPMVKEKSAMVAVHEKGRHVVCCTAKNNMVGHGGLNPSTGKTTILRMSEFIAEVSKSKIFKSKFHPEVEETFKSHAPFMPFVMRLIFANFNIFKGILKKLLPKLSGAVASMFKTTMSFTMIEGGKSEQIQSKEVIAHAFFRCVREEDYFKELELFRKIATKHEIEVTEILRDYCKPSSSSDWQFQLLEKTLHQNFPDVIVSPFLLTAGSDARHFTDVADSILRFAPIDLNPQQYSSIHSVNENITAQNIGECVLFYEDFVKIFPKN